MDGIASSFELDDPSDWPSTLPHLRELDNLLRCPICKEYFNTAMVTGGCGHTFCSLCVRRCLTQETKCPSCRAPLNKSELRPNRLVDNLMRTFKGGRQLLLNSLTKSNSTPTNSISNNAETVFSGYRGKSASKEESTLRKRQRISTRSSARISNEANNENPAFADSDAMQNGLSFVVLDDDGDIGVESDENYTDNERDFVPAKSNNKKIDDTRRTEESTASVGITPQQQDTKVHCPNCKQLVSQSLINRHLDRCLSSLPSSNESSTVSAVSQAKKHLAPMLKPQSKRAATLALPKPTKLAYSLLSESKLRRTLKDLGIPPKGDKNQMQTRHIEWVNMYLANEDSESPVSHRALLKQLAAWEESMASNQGESGAKQQPSSQQSSSTSITDHAAKYADSFATLVAQASSAMRTKDPSCE
ncbi:hypothetical protein BX070DRAFT_233718 [Coemansia spiralis]|nr:hypothetical protein BX070DRAFT_233718 [Coemansia spiralis]